MSWCLRLDKSIIMIEDGLWSWASAELVVYLIMVVKKAVDEVHTPFRHGNHDFLSVRPHLKNHSIKLTKRGKWSV